MLITNKVYIPTIGMKNEKGYKLWHGQEQDFMHKEQAHTCDRKCEDEEKTCNYTFIIELVTTLGKVNNFFSYYIKDNVSCKSNRIHFNR